MAFDLMVDGKNIQLIHDDLVTIRGSCVIDSTGRVHSGLNLRIATDEPLIVRIENHWLPIDSAPKDGTPILVRSRDRSYIATWNKDGDSWVRERNDLGEEILVLQDTGSWSSQGGWFEPHEVTQWMPLPC